jgi:hypothetical protein
MSLDKTGRLLEGRHVSDPWRLVLSLFMVVCGKATKTGSTPPFSSWFMMWAVLGEFIWYMFEVQPVQSSQNAHLIHFPRRKSSQILIKKKGTTVKIEKKVYVHSNTKSN